MSLKDFVHLQTFTVTKAVNNLLYDFL